MYELSDEQYQKLKHAAWLARVGQPYNATSVIEALLRDLNEQLNESLEKRAELEREFGPNLNREFEANPSS